MLKKVVGLQQGDPEGGRSQVQLGSAQLGPLAILLQVSCPLVDGPIHIREGCKGTQLTRGSQ